MQKKVFVYLLACALPLLPACVRETPEQEEESISPVTGEGSEEGLVKLEFSAALEDESRTWLDGTAVKWRGTDKIAVIDNTSPYVHVFDNTDVDGGARCRFVGEAGMPPPGPWSIRRRHSRKNCPPEIMRTCSG